MVVRPRKRARSHLYIKEWLEHRGLNIQGGAKKLGIQPNSLSRWIHEQHRLSPLKIAELAVLFDCEPEELWRPPGHISLDAIIADSDEGVREIAANILRQLVRKP